MSFQLLGRLTEAGGCSDPGVQARVDLQNIITINPLDQMWWCMPLISPFGRQRQVALWEFDYSLIYIVSPKPPGTV